MKDEILLDVDWENILSVFSTYKGTIVNFCKENNIKVHQLYCRRKRSKKVEGPTFHAIDFKEKSYLGKAEQVYASSAKIVQNIKIEIGKAKIYLDGNDKESLSNILSAILKSC